jgi:DNA helicase II / ATP-dependent DNA helicase PcrA
VSHPLGTVEAMALRSETDRPRTTSHFEDPLPPGLTPGQREAVMADDPVLCVLAGAGAGKTGVLTLRVARRSADSTAAAERILVCTFSRKAADELRTRLYRLGVVGVTAGTIHRVALRILRDWRDHEGGSAPIVLGDRRRLLEDVLASQSANRGTALNLEAEIGWAKARMIGPEQYEAAALEAGRAVRIPLGVTAQLFSAYEEARKGRGVLDLDDLLLESAMAMEQSRAFADGVRWRFRHLFVDEMQDVNAAQFRLLEVLVADQPDLFVVGDPNQSIYGWNGADPHLLADLPNVFPDTRVIRLDDNHRCSPGIVRMAAAALNCAGPDPISTREEGSVPVVAEHETDQDEARWVARQAWLAHRPGRRWGHVAVLARTNAQLRAIADALGDQRIPLTFASGELGPASDLDTPGDEGTQRSRFENGAALRDDETDGVVLSTFHRAKGLQWPCVFVIGICEGLVPIGSARSDDAIDEERRLLYVAMTRAEDELWCSWARRSGAGDARSDRRPSRWLGAIAGARAALEHEQAPAPPETVASHLAHIRSLVARDATQPSENIGRI